MSLYAPKENFYGRDRSSWVYAGWHCDDITDTGAYAHNNYAEVLASAGIFGFILYYGLYFWGLHISYRNRHDAISRSVIQQLNAQVPKH